MDGTFITTTRNADLQPLGTGGQRAFHVWDQIAGYARRRFGPSHAALFAEPNPDPGRGLTEWYADDHGAARPLSVLTGEEGEAVHAVFARLAGELREESERLRKASREDERFLGEMLALALITPGDEYVYVVDSQPVLVAWGHTRVGESARPELLIGARPTATGRRPAAAGRMEIVRPPAVVRRVPWMAWLASGLATFAILALIPYLLLLDPVGWFMAPVAQCVASPSDLALQEDLRQEERRESAMRAEIARIALAMGDRRIACPPLPPRRQEPQAPSREEAQRNADVKRAEKEGARSGRLQVILAWDDTSDLDLSIACPKSGQVIEFSNKSACGGTLDVDRNVNNPTPNAVESIVFDREPTPGRYQIYVRNYKQGPEAPTRTPYRVTVRQEGQPDRFYTGEIASGPRNNVGYFDVPAQR